MKKRIFSLLLAVCLLMGLLPTVAFAEGETFTAIDGTAGANKDNSEDCSSLFDGQPGTKWCVSGFKGAYVIFRASEAMKVTGYYITTGNDNESYHGRNPKDWVLYGCNDATAGRDSESWVEIHKVENDKDLKDQNQVEYYYAVPEQNTLYQYFKLEITANNGSTEMQMSEFRLTSCEHIWVAGEATSATCETKGYTTYSCSECHNTKIANEVEPLGHAFDTDGTCTRVGCGENKDDLYTFNVSQGRVTIMDDEYDNRLLVRHGYKYVRYIDADQVITVTGSGTGTNNELHVNAKTPVKIKVKDLTINTSAKEFANAMSLDEKGANVTLILEGENFIAGGLERAGISVGVGKTLTIAGTGTLTVKGGKWAAGIGGSSGEGCGTVIIKSGTLTATGGDGAAGIGAGSGNSNHGTFKTANNGTAVIFASTIGDQSQKESWSGIIFEGDNGAVYGNQTLTADLTIPQGTSLTIPEGKILTNNGTINNSGAIYVDGTLTGQVTDTDTGAVYYPLTLNNCTANGENTSEVNGKTYGKAGGTITLTPALLVDQAFDHWEATPTVTFSDDSFEMPSEALTVTAKFVRTVSSQEALQQAINEGETYIKLMNNISIGTAVEVKDKQITLDLNGHIFGVGNTNLGWEIIQVNDGGDSGYTSLTLVDSNPTVSNTVGDKVYKGGVINGKIAMTVDNSSDRDCRLYANGGSVLGQVGFQSGFAKIYCTSKTPTAFYDSVNGNYGGSIYGGIFYGTFSDIMKQYTRGKIVTFKYNNSTYARQVVESGKTAVAPIPPQEPDENGYHINWYEDGADVSTDASYDFSTTVDKNITLTAAWQNTYRITFNTAGGSAVKAFMQVVNTEATLPDAPTKTDYTFTGWSDGTKTYQAGDKFTMPANDVTLTAQWTPTIYNITYELNGGTATNPKSYTVESDNITLTNPTKTGHTFTGWSGTDLTGENNTTVTITAGSSGDRSFTAHWIPNVYTVTLNTNGGTIRAGDVTEYTYGVGAKLPVFVTKTGYNFAGWYDNEDCKGKPVTEITTTDDGDLTFYAAWVPATLTYPPALTQPENGSVTTSPKYPTAGSEVTITPEPDEGYEVDEVTVTDKDGNPVEVTDNGDGTFTFQQPFGKVTITVTFKETETEPEKDPVKDCLKDGTCPASKFTDVKMDWTHDGIHYCVENGLMDGIGDTTFAPDSNLSRAMLMTILARLDGVDTTGGETWYEKGMDWAVANGISDGTSGDANITREQIVTMLYRYAVYKGYDVSVGENTNILSFADAEEISSWAKDAMQWAVGTGLLNGKDGNLLDPTGKATRAEMAAILYRFCENVAE